MNFVLVAHKYAVPLDDPCCYPLGFMYVSAALKKNHNVKVLNYNLWDYDFKEEIKGADVVAFTGFEEFYPYIKRDAAICREMGIATWVGGALATFRSDLMKDVCDVVVAGEYGTYPLPDYEGFGIDEYHNRHSLRYMGVLASRGCPFHCSFCVQTCYYHERPLEDVEREIRLYKSRYGVETIIFNDNTLNVTKDRFLKICALMKGLRVSWSAAIRLDKFNDQMAQAAKESRCAGLIVGVESFSPEKLYKMNKHVTVDQIHKGLDLLHKYHLRYYGNVLVGFEGDTFESITQELLLVPEKYNLLPAFVRPFIGVKETAKHSLTAEQKQTFETRFSELVSEKRMYMYPELPSLPSKYSPTRVEQATEGEFYLAARVAKGFEKCSKHVKIDVEYLTKRYKSLSQAGVGAVFVLKNQERIVGVFSCLKAADIFTGDALAIETGWFVLPEFRGAGLKLLTAFDAWAKEQGCKRKALIHMEDSFPEALKKLYVRKGYSLVESHYVAEVV